MSLLERAGVSGATSGITASQLPPPQETNRLGLLSQTADWFQKAYEWGENIIGAPGGAITAAPGAIIGGAVGAIGTPIKNLTRNLWQGKSPTQGLFKDFGKNVMDTGAETAKFGYDVGKKGTMAFVSGKAGHPIGYALAGIPAVRGLETMAEGIQEEDPMDQVMKGVVGGLLVGIGALGAYGTHKSPTFTGPGGTWASLKEAKKNIGGYVGTRFDKVIKPTLKEQIKAGVREKVSGKSEVYFLDKENLDVDIDVEPQIRRHMMENWNKQHKPLTGIEHLDDRLKIFEAELELDQGLNAYAKKAAHNTLMPNTSQRVTMTSGRKALSDWETLLDDVGSAKTELLDEVIDEPFGEANRVLARRRFENLVYEKYKAIFMPVLDDGDKVAHFEMQGGAGSPFKLESTQQKVLIEFYDDLLNNTETVGMTDELIDSWDNRLYNQITGNERTIAKDVDKIIRRAYGRADDGLNGLLQKKVDVLSGATPNTPGSYSYLNKEYGALKYWKRTMDKFLSPDSMKEGALASQLASRTNTEAKQLAEAIKLRTGNDLGRKLSMAYDFDAMAGNPNAMAFKDSVRGYGDVNVYGGNVSSRGFIRFALGWLTRKGVEILSDPDEIYRVAIRKGGKEAAENAQALDSTFLDLLTNVAKTDPEMGEILGSLQRQFITETGYSSEQMFEAPPASIGKPPETREIMAPPSRPDVRPQMNQYGEITEVAAAIKQAQQLDFTNEEILAYFKDQGSTGSREMGGFSVAMQQAETQGYSMDDMINYLSE